MEKFLRFKALNKNIMFESFLNHAILVLPMLTERETGPGGWRLLNGRSLNRRRWRGCALRETGSVWSSSKPGGSPDHSGSEGGYSPGDIPSPWC